MAFDGRMLAGIGVLAAVIEGGSFVRAAEALGLSASGVSRAIARLEARVGVRLLDRTTRAVTLTDEGRRLYAEIGPLLNSIDDAVALAGGSSSTVRGRLRVNVDAFFSRLMLAPRLRDFFSRYPEISLELMTRDTIGDLVADGFDVAVRFGEPPSSSLLARKLLETRILTVAAPSYLAAHGRPARPIDLAHHACIQYRDPWTGRPFEWEFHRGRKIVPIEVQGPLLVNDVETMLSACIAGAGVAQIMAIGVQALLDDGRLVELFPDWPDERFPLYAFYASRRHPPAKLRAFIDFCNETLV